MRTPASIAGHPIHPMLVTIPIGLWIFSLVCDLVHVFGAADPVWSTVAVFTMAGGVVGALLAAIPGLIDLLSLPERPRKTALMHMTINLIIVALYLVNLWLRLADTSPRPAQGMDFPVWLSLLAVAMLAVSGWLGGHMVYVEQVAVSGANDHPKA